MGDLPPWAKRPAPDQDPPASKEDHPLVVDYLETLLNLQCEALRDKRAKGLPAAAGTVNHIRIVRERISVESCDFRAENRTERTVRARNLDLQVSRLPAFQLLFQVLQDHALVNGFI